MKRKLFLYFSIAIVASMLLAMIVGYRTIESLIVKEIEIRIAIEAGLVKEMIEKELSVADAFPTAVFFDELVKRTDCRLAIILPNGQVYYDSGKDPETIENYLNKNRFIYSTTPVLKGGSIICDLRLTLPIDKDFKILEGLSRSLVISIIAAMIFAFLMAYIASGYIVSPLSNIAEIVLKESNLEPVYGKAVFKGNEIALITSALKTMSSKLNESRYSINDKKVKMEAILASVINGIIAIDNDEKVLFINPYARMLLKIKEEKVEGKYFFRIVKNRIFNRFVEKSVCMDEYNEEEIVLGALGRVVYRVYSNPIKHKDTNETLGSIVVFQDISEIRKLERMRRDFTANVSHELKTPLTSIKGFAETLKDGAIDDPEAAERFLGIILNEADRLQRLIEDILSLTDVETGNNKDYFENFGVDQVIDEVVSILSAEAKKKNIVLEAFIAENLPAIFGDRDQFKQMFINLLDNGIKYNKDDGKVTVFAEKLDSNRLKIIVRDNGIGIEEEDIPRIFERFYRVDKARSRKVGGTGLGLAIVKHIVMNFNGKIEIKSKLGEGTDFIIEIPIG